MLIITHVNVQVLVLRAGGDIWHLELRQVEIVEMFVFLHFSQILIQGNASSPVQLACFLILIIIHVGLLVVMIDLWIL